MSTSRRNLLLVDTSPIGRRGSMNRYADLVHRAVAPMWPGWAVERIRLAMPHAALRRFGPRLGTWLQHGWLLTTAGARLRRRRAALYHVLDGSHAYVAAGLLADRCVVTCHDLIPLLQSVGRLPGQPGRMAGRVIRSSRDVQRAACRVVADSENTRCDLIASAGCDPARVRLVPLGLEAGIPPSKPSATEPGQPGLDPYILHVGNDAPYKNRAGVVRVFAAVCARAQVRLVIAGPPSGRAVAVLAARLGVADRIAEVGEVPDDTLWRLYSEAALLLFPSLYEGFGWPVLEAMACGCPVVCSNAASLPEVAGDAALTAPAEDEELLARHCTNVLADMRLASDLRERGRQRAATFTVERMAQGLMSAYREVVAGI